MLSSNMGGGVGRIVQSGGNPSASQLECGETQRGKTGLVPLLNFAQYTYCNQCLEGEVPTDCDKRNGKGIGDRHMKT